MPQEGEVIWEYGAVYAKLAGGRLIAVATTNPSREYGEAGPPVEEVLNQLGALGWDLVQIFPAGDGFASTGARFVYQLKRGALGGDAGDLAYIEQMRTSRGRQGLGS